MKTKITVDSTCDVDDVFLKSHNFAKINLTVIMGETEYFDTLNITNDDIKDSVKKTGKLPKTAARSIEDYKEFFSKILEEGYENIIHFSISNELSSSYDNALIAAKEIDEDKIFVINGRVLSTGTTLLALSAEDLLKSGKTAKEVYEIIRTRSYNCQTSFIVDTVDYLYKGGRCSMLALLGANFLKIKPKLQLVDGKIVSTERYRGKSLPVLKKYIDDTLHLYNNPDKKRCFITHANQEQEIVDELVEYLKNKNIFEEVIVSKANSVVYSHCGKGTLGILYLNDGGNI